MSSSSNAGGERPSSRNDNGDNSGPMAKPDFFYGDRNKVEDWLNQLRMYFFFKGTPSGQQTMMAATYLRGRAQHWLKPEVTEFLSDPGSYNAKGVMRSFKEFSKQLKLIFGASKDAEENASVRIIQTLRQKGSASDYTSRFKEYMPLTGWDEEALKVMYRNGLKENVKDELMRSGASLETLENLIVESIRIDDMLYERQMEKRHFHGKATPYTSRGGTGGYNRDRGDPMELDATMKRRYPKGGKGKGKGNKKDGMKCYSCGKSGHMKKDCRQNKVQRQVNMMQLVPSGRGAYDTTGTPHQEAKDREHACLSWTACYDDSCRVHLSDKEGSGWFPTKRRQELNVIQRKPLQQSRDGGNGCHPRSPPLKREDATLQENQESGIAEIEPGQIPETPEWMRRTQYTQNLTIADYQSQSDSDDEPSPLALDDQQWEERVEQAQLLATTQSDPGHQSESDEELTEEPIIDDSDGESEPDDVYTWTMEGPIQLYRMTQTIAQAIPAAFPIGSEGRQLHPTQFDMLIDKLRAMFWNHALVDVEYDYSRFVMERPPLGSQFHSTGGYVTPDGCEFPREIRIEVIQEAKRKYHLIQEKFKWISKRRKRQEQLGTIPDCDTSDESGNDEAPDAEAANGSF